MTIIVPFSPGASSDGIARMVGNYLSDNMKLTIVVDNRVGGGGAVGLMAVSRAGADGATIGIGATGAVVINPHVSGAPAFDPLKQLTTLAKLVDIPLVLVASPSSGLRTINDVVAKSKETSGGLSFGSTGVNSSQHLSIEVLKQMTGANLTHVPYRGSAPAATDLIGGQLPLACVDLTSVVEQIKAGNLVPIGVTAAKRYSIAPDIPTFAEQGLKGFDVPAWLGMFGPAGLSGDVVERYSEALGKAMSDADVAARAERLACQPAFLGPKEFASFLKEQSEKMKPLVKLVEGTK
ncbi:Bug family tripartite tricarboxylate transporter substrate binding protein [Bradyrhizobium mercantei]|uniref:Bug family tripartite tricarboxylate transporter substrate binding protein n=1 Tax=Bradyrhizobium mercantei TaxID=1904807 RepID=UPI0013566944|nr:tripartite tricarboxylate transporter substrate binding protein [Bradyrhizobium mercantei]